MCTLDNMDYNSKLLLFIAVNIFYNIIIDFGELFLMLELIQLLCFCTLVSAHVSLNKLCLICWNIL